MVKHSITTLLVALYETLTMNAGRSIFLLALCFVCVSSSDEENFENSCQQYSDLCETHILRAPLRSSVLLPCTFATSSDNWVSWSHTPGVNLINLTSKGRIKFLDPRYGRVKAFPNQGSQGNYSICIDELKTSDLGCYRCQLGHDCLQVEVVAETGAQSEDMKLLIYICVGLAAFLLLSVGICCCSQCIKWCCNNRTEQNNYTINPVGAGAEGVSAPPEEKGRVPVDERQRGADNELLVYENDDQDPGHHPIRNHLPGALPDPDTTQAQQSTGGIYPNLNQCDFERMESQRTKHRFHRELFNRLRQASFSRHYYVNHSEISQQQAMSAQEENRPRAGLGKKKAKQHCQFRNPIYTRSTDQLNQLQRAEDRV